MKLTFLLLTALVALSLCGTCNTGKDTLENSLDDSLKVCEIPKKCIVQCSKLVKGCREKVTAYIGITLARNCKKSICYCHELERFNKYPQSEVRAFKRRNKNKCLDACDD